MKNKKEIGIKFDGKAIFRQVAPRLEEITNCIAGDMTITDVHVRFALFGRSHYAVAAIIIADFIDLDGDITLSVGGKEKEQLRQEARKILEGMGYKVSL